MKFNQTEIGTETEKCKQHWIALLVKQLLNYALKQAAVGAAITSMAFARYQFERRTKTLYRAFRKRGKMQVIVSFYCQVNFFNVRDFQFEMGIYTAVVTALFTMLASNSDRREIS